VGINFEVVGEGVIFYERTNVHLSGLCVFDFHDQYSNRYSLEVLWLCCTLVIGPVISVTCSINIVVIYRNV